METRQLLWEKDTPDAYRRGTTAARRSAPQQSMGGGFSKTAPPAQREPPAAYANRCAPKQQPPGRTPHDARRYVNILPPRLRVLGRPFATSGSAGARGLAKANAEAEAFYRNLKGFLVGRDELNEATLGFMPTNGAAKFDDVGAGVVPRQDLGDTAVGVDAQLAALYARAPAAKEALDGFCRRVAAEAGLDPDQEMIREARDDGREDKVLRAYSAGPLKGEDRATEKTKNEYDGDAARLVDVVRGSIVCGDEASLVTVLAHVLGYSDEAGDVCVVRSKNRFRTPLFNGYRDVLFNLRLRLPDGTSMVVELQVHLVQILEHKAKSHVFYEYFRTYFRGNVVVVAERMKVLESIAGGDGAAGLADAVESIVKARDASKLKALDDLLEKLAVYDLLAVVRECLRDMALAAHGEDSVEHSDALNKLASLLQAQGKFAAAELVFRRSLEIKEKQLGPDHPDVATLLNNLAELLRVQGKLDDADPLFRRALGIREKQLGPDHPSVALSLNNLATLLKAQGKLDAAEPLYCRGLEIREKQLGPDHPVVAQSLNALAELLRAQGKLDAAEPLHRRSLEIREKQFGPDHPGVATALNNLALLLNAQGRLDAAEPLFRRALGIREKQLGLDHPDVAQSLNNLALLLWRLGRLDAALPLQEKATSISKRRGDAKEAEYRGELDKMRSGAPYPDKQ